MRGHAWARGGFATGVIASIGANIAHSFLLPAPAAGAIIIAAFWPIALLISIEVITRVEWPPGWAWRIVRYGGLTTVAAIAAVISYRHMAALLAAYGEDSLGSAIGPLAVDGLMAVCSGALIAIAAQTPPAPATDVVGNGLMLAAKRAYSESIEAGKPLTGKALGEQFGRGQRWGRNIIAELRNQQ